MKRTVIALVMWLVSQAVFAASRRRPYQRAQEESSHHRARPKLRRRHQFNRCFLSPLPFVFARRLVVRSRPEKQERNQSQRQET